MSSSSSFSSLSSFPGSASRRARQDQRSELDNFAARQDERTHGRQYNRRPDSPVPSSLPRRQYGISGYGSSGYDGSPRHQRSPTRLLSPRRRRSLSEAKDSVLTLRARRENSHQEESSKSCRRSLSRAKDSVLALRERRRDSHQQDSSTHSRGRQVSPQRELTRYHYQSPPARTYAPRSTSSGNLSFCSQHASVSSLNIGPPAMSSSHGRSPVHETYHHVRVYRASPQRTYDSDTSTVRDTSPTRNPLSRVPRSEYRPERESPRDAFRHAQLHLLGPEHARGPESAVPVESVRQRGIERYHNADGSSNWYEQHLRHARPTEAQRDREGTRPRGKRVEQQGFRKWYWGQ